VIETHFFGKGHSSVHEPVVGVMYFLIISGVVVSDCVVEYCSN
jgi:hypothetical protein